MYIYIVYIYIYTIYIKANILCIYLYILWPTFYIESKNLSSKGIPYIYGIHCNNYIVKRQTFAIDTGYYWYLNICIYNLQSCYETSRQNKKEENLNLIKVLILLLLLLRFI